MSMSQAPAPADGSILRALLLVLLLIVAIPVIMMIVMMPLMGGWGVGHMNGWMWDGTGSSWAWMAMWLVMLGLLVGGGYVIYRSLSSIQQTADPALQELRSAYARGDLSDEEYEQRLERLKQP